MKTVDDVVAAVDRACAAAVLVKRLFPDARVDPRIQQFTSLDVVPDDVDVFCDPESGHDHFWPFVHVTEGDVCTAVYTGTCASVTSVLDDLPAEVLKVLAEVATRRGT